MNDFSFPFYSIYISFLILRHTHTHTHTMSNKRTVPNLFVNYIDFPVTGPNIFYAFQRQSVFDKYRRINIKINCCLLVTVKVICFNKFAAKSQVQLI